MANSKPLSEVKIDNYDTIFLVGRQGTMYTYYNDERVHEFVAESYEAGKVTAIVYHATCVLLKTRLSDGNLLINGKRPRLVLLTRRNNMPITLWVVVYSPFGLK